MPGIRCFSAAGAEDGGQGKNSGAEMDTKGRPPDPEGRPIYYLILSLYSPGVIPTYFLNT